MGGKLIRIHQKHRSGCIENYCGQHSDIYKIKHWYYYTQRRGLKEDQYCCMCQKETGTFLHLLLKC